jgi:2-oxoglutaroyl-CoA hydrolase
MTSYPTELDGLRWEKDASTRAGYLIFDRPPMNVVSFQARAQIAAIITAMDEDPDIRVIVIRGANGVYSSGGDIAGFLKVGKDGMHDLHWNVAAPERAKKPVIAAIEKWAMGVAFELALAADFRLATENTQLALPEINLGITPGSGGTVRIAHLVGLTRAKEMIMRGRRISAREALSWGLITEVVADEGMDAAVARWVADMAGASAGPADGAQANLELDLRSSFERGPAAGRPNLRKAAAVSRVQAWGRILSGQSQTRFF